MDAQLATVKKDPVLPPFGTSHRDITLSRYSSYSDAIRAALAMATDAYKLTETGASETPLAAAAKLTADNMLDAALNALRLGFDVMPGLYIGRDRVRARLVHGEWRWAHDDGRDWGRVALLPQMQELPELVPVQRQVVVASDLGKVTLRSEVVRLDGGVPSFGSALRTYQPELEGLCGYVDPVRGILGSMPVDVRYIPLADGDMVVASFGASVAVFPVDAFIESLNIAHAGGPGSRPLWGRMLQRISRRQKEECGMLAMHAALQHELGDAGDFLVH